MKLRVFHLVLGICSVACAQSPDEVDELVTRLRAEDASARDEAERVLLATPDLPVSMLQKGCQDPDLEFASRCFRILEKRGRLPAELASRRAQSILESLSTEHDISARFALIDEFILLGDTAASLLQLELANSALELVPGEVFATEGHVVRSCEALVKNCGTVGLWVRDADLGSARTRPIGSKNKVVWNNPDHYAPSRVTSRVHSLRQWLCAAKRIAPGRTQCLFRTEISIREAPCAIFEICDIGTSRVDSDTWTIGSTATLIPDRLLPSRPQANGLLLRKLQSDSFDAKVISEDGRFGLRITALREHARITSIRSTSTAWYAAIDSSGLALGFGPLEDESLLPPWSAGEQRTVWIQDGIPESCSNLWCGFDPSYEAQIVPDPLDVSKNNPNEVQNERR